MNKTISISNPNKVQSLIVQPYGGGDKIGGVLDLSIFTTATNISVSNIDIEELGELPLNLISFNGSFNKITNITSAFSITESVRNFNLKNNKLTTVDINNILTAFEDNDYDTPLPDDSIIDISQFGNAVPDSTGISKIQTLNSEGWVVKYNPGEYVLSTNAKSVSEGGQSLTIDINRTISDIPDGATVPYVISGVQADDFSLDGFDGDSPSNLQGSFTITDNTDSATFSFATDVGVDKYLEGETFTMTIHQLTQIDSSNLSDGTYTITVQGESVTFVVANGSVITDISALSIYVPADPTSTITITDTAVSPDTDITDIQLTGTSHSISVPIVDKTIVPYDLTVDATQSEGSSFNITLAPTIGTTVANGTTVPYTISQIQGNDIAEDLTGEFTLQDNVGQITITVLADENANENETMILTLDDYPTVNVSVRLFDT